MCAPRRGQAWAVFGFAQYHAASGDAAALAAARRAADKYLERMAEWGDCVPPWDFDVPAGAQQVRSVQKGNPPLPAAAPLSTQQAALTTNHCSQPALVAPAPDPPPFCSLPATLPQPWKDSSAAAIAAAGLLRLGPLAGERRYAAAGLRITRALTQRYLASPAAPGPALASVLLNGTWSVPAGNYATGLIWGDFFLLDALVLLQRLTEEVGVLGAPPPVPAPGPASLEDG